jgi:ferredoxin/flavodoxin---NADP+ reductase
MTVAELEVDLTIIGAGPTGLYAAYYAGFRGLSTAVIDSLSEPGGQVTALYPEKDIFDVAGFPSVKGKDLIDAARRAGRSLRSVLPARSPRGRPRAPRRRLLHRDDQPRDEVRTKAVLITGGIGHFTPRPLPDGDDYEGRGLVYFVRALESMRDDDVLIVGGGDSAVDWALNLEGIARSITLIHRRDRFRAHEDSVAKLLASTVEVLTYTEVATIDGRPRHRAVEVFDNKTDERRLLKVNKVVAALGFKSDLGPLKTWDIVIDGRTSWWTPGCRPPWGVFAAGDITEYEGKVRLIAVGFGEAATAVNNAAVYIDPTARVFPGHSSG